MVFNADEFHYYHPYLTFCNPENDRFVDPTGKILRSIEDPDEEALFLLARDAYKLIARVAPLTREIFDQAYSINYVESLGDLRDEIRRLHDAKSIVLTTRRGAPPVDVDVSELDAGQVLSICWQIYKVRATKVDDQEYLGRMFFGLFLFHALREVDHALIGLRLDGGAVIAGIEAANALANAMAIDSRDDNLLQARKKLAYQGAIEKIRRDPKQKEKEFIKACWAEWQENPNRYASKAAFARDMLSKCEHLTSQKKIEDWCREWELPDTP